TAFAHANGVALRKRYGLGNDPVIGFVGRQVRLKGAVTLLEAMKIVWESHDCARVLLAGCAVHRDEATHDQLHAIGAAYPSRVVLIDDFPTEQAADIFSACDIV